MTKLFADRRIGDIFDRIRAEQASGIYRVFRFILLQSAVIATQFAANTYKAKGARKILGLIIFTILFCINFSIIFAPLYIFAYDIPTNTVTSQNNFVEYIILTISTLLFLMYFTMSCVKLPGYFKGLITVCGFFSCVLLLDWLGGQAVSEFIRDLPCTLESHHIDRCNSSSETVPANS